jgi:hypothetical protein
MRAKGSTSAENIYRKGRLMRDKLIPLFLGVAFLIFISCSPEHLPDNGISILSPKANDVFKAGDFYQIQWRAEPMESEFGVMVTVEFSKDGGQSWEKMEENVPNSGTHLWRVPEVDSAQCKLRVFSQRKPIYRGTSEVFSVKP